MRVSPYTMRVSPGLPGSMGKIIGEMGLVCVCKVTQWIWVRSQMFKDHQEVGSGEGDSVVEDWRVEDWRGFEPGCA